MSNPDLTNILHEWPFERGRINARRIEGEDGQDKLQIRVDLGVLQLEMTGRPDGVRPEGYESLLEYQQDRLRRYMRETGVTQGFVLSTDECRALREEAVQYYHRYVALFVIQAYSEVLRDTTRNLAVFDLCREFGQTTSDRTLLEQFRPHVLMMRTRGEAELGLAAGRPKSALAAIDRGLDEIQRFYDDCGSSEAFDDANEVQLLRGMREALVPRLPASQNAELRERLQAALAAENYELAAILRDELKMLQ